MRGRKVQAGRSFISVDLEGSKRVEKALRKLSAKMQSIGSGIASIGKASVAIGAGILGAFAAPVKAASDLEETMNKFNVVFGDSATLVKAWGDEYARQVGRSKRQVADFLASSQDLLVPLGLDPKAAEETSKQLTKLSVDLASFNNMADADTMRDLQAALTGSGEVMKKYGVIVSEAAVKQELLDQGLDPKNVTEAQKAMARLDIIMRGTTAAQGDAERSAGSFANQMKALWANAENIAGALGERITPMLAGWIELVNRGATTVETFVRKNGELIEKVFMVGAALLAGGAALAGLGIGLQLIGFVVGGLATGLSTVAAALGFLLSPVGLVTAAIAAGVTYFALYTEAGQAMVADVMGYFGELGEIAGTTFEGIKNALANGNIEAAGKILWAGLELVWQRGTAALRKLWNDVSLFFVNTWSSAINEAAQWFNFLTGTISRGWSHSLGFVQDLWSITYAELAKAGNGLVAFFERVWARIKGLFGGDATAEIARINTELAKSNAAIDQARDGAIVGRGDDREDAIAKSRREQEQIKQQLESDLQRQFDQNQSKSDAAVLAAEQKLADAKAELERLSKEQADQASEAAEKATEEAAKGTQAAAARAASGGSPGDSGAGVFNALAISGLARLGGDTAERTATAAEETAEESKKQTKLLNDRVLVVGD